MLIDTYTTKKIRMNCPLCGMTHEVEERKQLAVITLKGERVVYEKKYYHCINAAEDESDFETGSMANENLLNARNAYLLQKEEKCESSRTVCRR